MQIRRVAESARVCFDMVESCPMGRPVKMPMFPRILPASRRGPSPFPSTGQGFDDRPDEYDPHVTSKADLQLAALLLGVTLLAPPAGAAMPSAAAAATWSGAKSGSFVVLTDMGVGTATTACRNLALISEALPRTSAALALVSPLPTYVFVMGDHDLFDFCLPGSSRPAALFMPAFDRNLIIVDGSSPEKWPALYHEYLHSHLRANFPGIPVW